MQIDPDLGSVFKCVSTPEAEYLAELRLLQTEIAASRRLTEIYFERYEREDLTEDEKLIATAIFRDAVILLYECFTKSEDRRGIKPTPEQVFGHIPCWDEFWEGLWGLRNYFAGHNHGAQRQVGVGVQCRAEADGLKAVRLMSNNSTMGGWPIDREIILGFINVALVHFDKRIEEAQRPVWEQVEKLTPEQLAELPDLTTQMPTFEDWRSSRSEFQKDKRERQSIASTGRSRRIVESE
jgi:hypothetical protein